MLQENTDTQALLRRIKERHTFVSEAINAAEYFLCAEGKQVSHVVKPNHTETVRELDAFKGFSFRNEGVYSMYGGQNLQVWHHPTPEKKVLVLDVEWWNSRELHVRAFAPTTEWQIAIILLMEEARLKQAEAEGQRRREKIQAEQREADQARERASDDLEKFLASNILKHALELGIT